MGFFDVFHKKEQQDKNFVTVKVGDWVTQYSAGYWQVVEIFPKYADGGYCREGMQWKKGERIGNWVILKKGLTSKMKPSNACELVDEQWCERLPMNVVQSIEAVFEENPKSKQKFDKAPTMPKPAITNVWLMLSTEQAELFSECLSNLSERFTWGQFTEHIATYRQYVTDPSKATYILHLFQYPWEINDEFELLYFDPKMEVVTH